VACHAARAAPGDRHADHALDESGDALTVGFEQILLQRDAVGPGAAEVLDTFVWWNGVRNQDFGYAAAAGLIKGVISIGLVLAANKVAHLMGEQGVYKK
jgi:putative aldouronate transport system permease protein